MTINAVIGSGVFLLPTETFKLLGPFSLWAPLIFAVPVGSARWMRRDPAVYEG
jgi:hypothetical protein